jgi:DNA-binding protein H-NS
MQVYQQNDIEIANNDKEIERCKNELAALVAKREKMVEIELADLVARVNYLGGYATVESQKKSGAPRAPSTGPKKYRDPATGAEWSGQGGIPEWLVGDDKDQFLNPTWLAGKAAKTTKENASSQGAAATSMLGAPVADMEVQVAIDQQEGPTSAEPELSLVDSNANVVAEVDAVQTLNVAPIVAATSSPSVSQHDNAPPPVNPAVEPVAAQAA